jgi:alkanesulfonate monooxygenase SsuD/methylene tetrahydromethanopterin reductase-like flavin-dependent oxidoreductase (luciferase family)
MMAGNHDGRSASGRRPRRGFGVEGAVAPEIIRELAPAAEEAGYATFWVNDEPDGDGLATLREAAAVTTSIRLAVGVIPLDRQGPERIAARIDALDLPIDRLAVGVGSGGAAGGLERVRAGVVALRELTTAEVIVGAIGPRMCRLGGEVADGVLLDWASPEYARQVMAIVTEAAGAAGRPRPWLGAYVFTALGAAGGAKLRAAADYYAAIPSYAAHFARIGAEPLETTAWGEDDDALQRALAPFDAALDETVIRAVAVAETSAAYLDVLHGAAPETPSEP